MAFGRALLLGAALALFSPLAHAAERQEEGLGGGLYGVGLGVAAFTRDFAKTHAPGPEAELFLGYRFRDPYARVESFALGLNTRYSLHPGLSGRSPAHRLIVAWEGTIGFPVAANTELGLGMQVGVVYLSHLYGVGYDQGFLAFSRWRLPQGPLFDLTLKADVTDKKLFIKSAGVRSHAAFTEATLMLGVRVLFGPAPRADKP